MKLIRIFRYEGHIVKIYDNGYKGFDYEWKIRGPNKKNDPSSFGHLQSSIEDAKRTVDWFNGIGRYERPANITRYDTQLKRRRGQIRPIS